MGSFINRAAAIALLAALPMVAAASDRLVGVYALPGGQAKVTATLAATPGSGGQVLIDVTMTALGQNKPITKFETELSKQLHVIAISSDFRTFVHGHGDRPDPDGHFRLTMRLPRSGHYHIYTDAVPAGLDQQVLRFDLPVGVSGSGDVAPVMPKPSGLEATDGTYAVRFDPFKLHAGQETRLRLHVSHDGKAARDLTPFLGVAAHAVLIDSADLTYIHVHAAPDAGGADPSLPHDLTGTGAGSGVETDHHMAGMMGVSLPVNSHLPPDLMLHILAPKAGTYLLWLQFMAGGQVRTVRFVVAVP